MNSSRTPQPLLPPPLKAAADVCSGLPSSSTYSLSIPDPFCVDLILYPPNPPFFFATLQLAVDQLATDVSYPFVAKPHNLYFSFTTFCTAIAFLENVYSWCEWL